MPVDDVIIRRPRAEELDSIDAFFEAVLTDTFQANGIGHLTDALAEELADKKRALREAVGSHGGDRVFLLADCRGDIVGSAAHGPSNDLLNRCTDHALQALPEINTVFVHPRYQRRGLSALLLKHLLQDLHRKNIREVCFDSGYPVAQAIWRKKFGAPTYCLNDYWGNGTPHMIWRIGVKDALYALRPAE